MIDRLNLGQTCQRGVGPAGIEAGFEQPNEPPRDLRIAAQRFFQVVLAKCRAGLSQKLGVEAQRGNLASGQAGR